MIDIKDFFSPSVQEFLNLEARCGIWVMLAYFMSSNWLDLSYFLIQEVWQES